MGLIELRHWQWKLILRRIKEEYASEPSMYLSRDKMQRCLGWVNRDHKRWIDHTNETRGYYHERVCIDFFTASAESMFRMKYADILTQEREYDF